MADYLRRQKLNDGVNETEGNENFKKMDKNKKKSF